MSKGALTHDRVVQQAVRLASRDGLEGLSIGALAADLGLSKSGLFAHFGSKDALQLEVLHSAVARFTDAVVRPALVKERGLPRLRALLDGWLTWANDPAMPGGCLLVAASIELDDKPGPAREFLVDAQRNWLAALARAVRLAVEERHFKAGTSPEQLAFELQGMFLAYHQARRLLEDASAEARLRKAFSRLIEGAKR